MRAGKYRERAQFERRAEGARDRFGNVSGAEWGWLCTLWADLRETPGRERLAAGRLEASATGTLRVRATPASRAVTAGDRVIVRGHAWAIVGAPVATDAKGRELDFMLERGGAVE